MMINAMIQAFWMTWYKKRKGSAQCFPRLFLTNIFVVFFAWIITERLSVPGRRSTLSFTKLYEVAYHLHGCTADFAFSPTFLHNFYTFFSAYCCSRLPLLFVILFYFFPSGPVRVKFFLQIFSGLVRVRLFPHFFLLSIVSLIGFLGSVLKGFSGLDRLFFWNFDEWFFG